MLEIPGLIIIVALIVYIATLRNRIKDLEQRQLQQMTLEQQSILRTQIQTMLQGGKTIPEVVKFVREETGFGLVAAKHYVDQVQTEE
ncbi:hypothetical protein [Priestia koreensis]|uniref:hypothetical protein n=1 Tax=Priestia koreensis TaxID=284581 RepID=UPI0028F7351C|nr:hypothetical protein [Priestia koreensis]